MEKQTISKLLSGLGWFFGIGGTIASIIIGSNNHKLDEIIIPVGIILSIVNLGLFLGLSQIITNTYNTYLNTLNMNKNDNKKNSEVSTVKDELPNINYNNFDKAVSPMENGKYDEAIATFEAVNGYKDSENQIESCYIGKYSEQKWNNIKNINVGDTYTFGAYKQDNSTSDAKEAIEWTVLDKDGMSLLLISKQALDCQPYNTSYTDVTWKNCSLRKWMNGTFLNNAFSAEEQAHILNTTLSADKNPQYSTDPGKATTDKVFLLSITEAEKYFSSDSARQCKPTKYAVANGAYTTSDNGNCWWWLRSPGHDQDAAAFVHGVGSVYYRGISVIGVGDAVRPALWINLDS